MALRRRITGGCDPPVSSIPDNLVPQLPHNCDPAEVLDIARVHHIELLPRMFRLLAALTAQELNVTALARDLGIDDETVRSYLPLLETVFLLHRLPAWSRNLTARVKRRPRIHLTDTGLAAWLLEQSADTLGEAGQPGCWRRLW